MIGTERASSPASGKRSPRKANTHEMTRNSSGQRLREQAMAEGPEIKAVGAGIQLKLPGEHLQRSWGGCSPKDTQVRSACSFCLVVGSKL